MVKIGILSKNYLFHYWTSYILIEKYNLGTHIFFEFFHTETNGTQIIAQLSVYPSICLSVSPSITADFLRMYWTDSVEIWYKYEFL